jgi:hypothetical protein
MANIRIDSSAAPLVRVTASVRYPVRMRVSYPAVAVRGMGARHIRIATSVGLRVGS